MKKEIIEMEKDFVRADGVSYCEAVEKCIRHYVMRGYDLKDETKRFTNDPIEEVFRVYDIIVREEGEGRYPVC